jgi:hypothetical protein
MLELKTYNSSIITENQKRVVLAVGQESLQNILST